MADFTEKKDQARTGNGKGTKERRGPGSSPLAMPACMYPGTRQFTRIPRGPSSAARDLVKPVGKRSVFCSR